MDLKQHALRERQILPFGTLAVGVAVLVVVFINKTAPAEELSPQQMLYRSRAAFQAADTFQAEGAATMPVMQGSQLHAEMRTTYTICLKRPNLYRITWIREIEDFPRSNGAIWNAGGKPFVYVEDLRVYGRVDTNLKAFEAMSTFSGGAAGCILSMLAADEAGHPELNCLLLLKEPQFLEEAVFDGDPCYVISGLSDLTGQTTLWISKASFFLRKYEYSLEARDKAPSTIETGDHDTATCPTDVVTAGKEEDRKRTQPIARQGDMDSTRTETYHNIRSPALTIKDFNFRPPEGTRQDDSVFDKAN